MGGMFCSVDSHGSVSCGDELMTKEEQTLVVVKERSI